MSILGDHSKQILMVYMAENCGISFDKKGCSIADIESALKGILGSGSAIITEQMYKELQSLPE